MSTPRRSLRDTLALSRATGRLSLNGSGPAKATDERTPPAVPPGELTRRRKVVAERYAELQWDLGGLAYEMAIRDHFRLDVLQRQAAELQEIDTELAALERLERLESEGAAGTCPECTAPYARGAGFCWRCGHALERTVVAG